MTLDFNTPVCQHFSHQGQGIPAVFRLEHTKYGVTHYCRGHYLTLFLMVNDQQWACELINQHIKPAQERGQNHGNQHSERNHWHHYRQRN